MRPPGPKCARPSREIIPPRLWRYRSGRSCQPWLDLHHGRSGIFPGGPAWNRNSLTCVSINRHAALISVTAGGCSALARQRPATKGVPWRCSTESGARYDYKRILGAHAGASGSLHIRVLAAAAGVPASCQLSAAVSATTHELSAAGADRIPGSAAGQLSAVAPIGRLSGTSHAGTGLSTTCGGQLPGATGSATRGELSGSAIGRSAVGRAHLPAAAGQLPAAGDKLPAAGLRRVSAATRRRLSANSVGSSAAGKLFPAGSRRRISAVASVLPASR
jgi:hypothetical protein